MHSSSSRSPVALLAVAAMCVSLAAPLAARAAGNDAGSAGVGVARISLIQGSVAVQRGDSATPVTAVINAPVLGADYLTTGADSRSEVQFDDATAVRLGPSVQIRFTHLDAGDRELQLAEGTIELRLLRGGDGRTQIDTPSVSVRPRTAGAYRVTVDPDGKTEVTARSGSADVITPQATQPVAAGTTMLAQGPAANPTVQRIDTLAYDAFDAFNADRDAREQRALADSAYAATGVAGIDDLQTWGRWVSDGRYGRVWAPYGVTANWAPYRDGRYVWEDGYGWTWIGSEPWGWAPYHYGRWYHSANYGWCWYPPSYVTVWRPALVAFIGFGSGFGFGFGDIGWVPLAPFEPYYPWWGGSTTVVNVTNVTNNYYYNNGSAYNGSVYTGNPIKIYGNARYNGVTYVSHQHFLAGRFEHPLAAQASLLRSAQIVRGTVPLVPTDANLRFSERPAGAQLAVRPALLQRSFAGNAVVVARTPFELQRTTIAKTVHLPVASPVRQPVIERAVAVPNQTAAVHVDAPKPARTFSDPWSRFGASRGTPISAKAATAIPVIDGTTVTTAKPAATVRDGSAVAPVKAHDADVWTRFDTMARSGPGSVHQAVRTSDPPARTIDAPVRSNESTVRTNAAPVRTHDAPVRSNDASVRTNTAPARTYDAPRAAQHVESAPQATHVSAPAHAEREQRDTTTHATQQHPNR